MFSSCKNRATAWDVLKFASSAGQDGKFLETTGQMPMREHLTDKYPGYFDEHPTYKAFADQAERVVEVPNVPGSIDMWQTFRDEWTKSVVFGRESTDRPARRRVRITDLAEYGDLS